MKMSKKVWGRVRRYLKSTRAVSALEYAILVGVIAVGLTLALGTFSDSIDSRARHSRRRGHETRWDI